MDDESFQYEAEVELPGGTKFTVRGNDPRTVSAQAARMPSVYQLNEFPMVETKDD